MLTLKDLICQIFNFIFYQMLATMIVSGENGMIINNVTNNRLHYYNNL